ncbi:MAG TPA: serine hydrolase domain-containing protein [Vicinamibacterales bacterium]|nr:serine hydrolase domain-containing protein [Vicinamibacterales bacterium]
MKRLTTPLSLVPTFVATAALFAATATLQSQSSDPHPKTVEEFRSAVQAVLTETGVPGAGVALVRTSGVEWAGGVGVADRATGTPVTADTHFRAGSISKTFVAGALVQLYLDGDVELDSPVAELASDVDIDNAWEVTDPVRVIHLLQHTAGFDDMHFNEIYNLSDPPDMPLVDVLRRNPASRVVRWRPGTRMSYSNPGYAVAAHIIEKVTGEKYEDRIAERIFKPSGMPTSSFYLTKEDEARLAKGYRDANGPAVPFTPIYLRPAGNLHTSSRELANWVHVMLNWGETETDLVIDPEYLSNMEHPRTTMASDAGLRNGYGSGIASSFVEGFPMLGHAGGIDGFISSYAYSTSRDVGYVVLLNSTHSQDALRRISQLAVRYLKMDVEAPPKPTAEVADATLRRYEGYYHDASPRNQAAAFVEWLLAGRTIRVDGNHLVATPTFGKATPLIPVSDTLFRLESEPEATRVFIPGEGDQMIFAGASTYAERWPRWRVESVRWAVLASAAVVVTPLVALLLWVARARKAEPQGFWWLKSLLLLCAIAFVLPFIGVMNVIDRDLGTRNIWTTAMFAGSLLLPAAAVLSFMFVIEAWRAGAGRWFRAYALTVSLAALILSGYLSAWGMLAFRPWSY